MTFQRGEADLYAGLLKRVNTLEVENEHLRLALASRIVIEQAKGVLIERLDIPAEAVFELLRSAARRSRRKLHNVAAEVLETRVTPSYIDREVRHLLGGKGEAWHRSSS